MATRSAAEAKRLPTCNFFKELAFLNDVVQGRETYSNIVAISNKPQTPSEELRRQAESPPAELLSIGSAKSSIEVSDAADENIGRKERNLKNLVHLVKITTLMHYCKLLW